jgi:hypothetical protein
MNRRFFGLALALGLSGLLLGLTSDASGEEPMSADVHWRASVIGSPAVLYKVQIQDLDDPDGTSTVIDTTVCATSDSVQSYIFTEVEYARRYRGRVAGIDALGRQGDWSEWSPVYDREAPVPQH